MVSEILEGLAYNFVANVPLFFLVSMIGTALWGDGALITLVALAVNLKANLVVLFFAAFVGTFIGDSVWFFIGRKISKNIKKYERVNRGFETIAELIERVFKKNYTLALVTVKFLYGTRVITIFYLAKEKISYKKFLLYDSISTIFWLFGMGFVGYLVGLGVNWILHVVKNIQLAITFMIVILALFYLVQKLINKGLFKEEKILEKKAKTRSKK
jgi:membrane protein DedA with SNARE-associated domain